MAETPYHPEPQTSPEDEAIPIRRPLVGLCISFVAGLIYGFDFLPSPLPLAALALVLLGVVWRFSSAKWSAPLLHSAVALAAAAYASLTLSPPAPDHIGRQIEGDARFLDMVVTITDQPVLRDGERWIFPARVESIRQTVEWRRARGDIVVLLAAKEGAAAPAYGQRWYLDGLLQKRERGIQNTPWRLLARADAVQLGMGEHSRFYAWCIAQRERAARVLGIGLREADFPREMGMMRALMLGERTMLDDETRDAFSRTGTLHVVAISGGHVAIFLGLLAFFLQSIGIARPRWFWFITPLLVIYTTMAGLPSSAVRACLMAVLLAAAAGRKRFGDPLNVIAVAAYLILLVDPRQVYDAGFVLSFLLVIALILLGPPLHFAILRRLPRALTEAPVELDDEPRVARKFLHTAVQKTTSLLSATLAAWLVAEPLMAVFFNLRSPVALLVNLLVVPIASLILLCGSLSLVLGALVGGILPVAVEAFNHAGRMLITAMIRLVDGAAHLPGAWQFVWAPPQFWIFTYYILLLLILFAAGKVRRAALVTAAVLVAWWASDYAFNQRSTLEWFRNGETPVAFLDLPRADDILINTGDARSTMQLERFLETRGVDRLRALVLTRPSGEALGGAQKILREFPAAEVWLPAWEARSKITSNLLAYCHAEKIPVRELDANFAQRLPGGWRVEALHPRPGQRYRSAAAGGLALRFARDDFSFLFAGGTGPEFEAAMIAANRGFASDVLLAGGGEKVEIGSAFVAAAAPRVVVLPGTGRGVDVLAVERLGLQAGASARVLLRDEIWRLALPARGAFQTLESLGAGSSSDGNASWAGEVGVLDLW